MTQSGHSRIRRAASKLMADEVDIEETAHNTPRTAHDCRDSNKPRPRRELSMTQKISENIYMPILVYIAAKCALNWDLQC